MILDHFWLTDAQFAKIAPYLPADTRGRARVDGRRVISGIVHDASVRAGREGLSGAEARRYATRL